MAVDRTASALAGVHRELIIALAAQHKLPAIYYERYFVKDAAFCPTGRFSRSIQECGLLRRPHPQGRNAGRPAVQAPTKYQLVINLKTAKALWIVIPQAVLARTDELIE
jgi:putative tryptophan/tyrosine transport system substrate-binding protein